MSFSLTCNFFYLQRNSEMFGFIWRTKNAVKIIILKIISTNSLKNSVTKSKQKHIFFFFSFSMDYDYRLLHVPDMHNRCCNGRMWCVQVSVIAQLWIRKISINSFLFSKDICGIICAVMTWLLILYAEFVVMVVIIWPSPYPVYSTINMIIFNLLAFLAYASHIRTMFSDPVSPLSLNFTGHKIYHSFLFSIFGLGCCS